MDTQCIVLHIVNAVTVSTYGAAHLFHYHLAHLAYFQEIMEVMPYLGHHMWYPCSTVAASCTPICPVMWTP